MRQLSFLIPQIKLMSPTKSATRNVANDQFVFKCGCAQLSQEDIDKVKWVIDDKLFTQREFDQIDLDKDDITEVTVERDYSGVAKYTSDVNIKRLIILKTKSRKSTYKKL